MASRASKVYSPQPESRLGPAISKERAASSDPWRSGKPAGVQGGNVVTKGAVPAKQAKEAPGNQGAHNRHNTNIKPTGTREQLAQAGSVTTTRTVAPVSQPLSAQSAAKKLYPNQR